MSLRDAVAGLFPSHRPEPPRLPVVLQSGRIVDLDAAKVRQWSGRNHLSPTYRPEDGGQLHGPFIGTGALRGSRMPRRPTWGSTANGQQTLYWLPADEIWILRDAVNCNQVLELHARQWFVDNEIEDWPRDVLGDVL